MPQERLRSIPGPYTTPPSLSAPAAPWENGYIHTCLSAFNSGGLVVNSLFFTKQTLNISVLEQIRKQLIVGRVCNHRMNHLRSGDDTDGIMDAVFDKSRRLRRLSSLSDVLFCGGVHPPSHLFLFTRDVPTLRLSEVATSAWLCKIISLICESPLTRCHFDNCKALLVVYLLALFIPRCSCCCCCFLILNYTSLTRQPRLLPTGKTVCRKSAIPYFRRLLIHYYSKWL